MKRCYGCGCEIDIEKEDFVPCGDRDIWCVPCFVNDSNSEDDL